MARRLFTAALTGFAVAAVAVGFTAAGILSAFREDKTIGEDW